MEKQAFIKIIESLDINKIKSFNIEYEDFSVDEKIKNISFENYL